MQTNRQSAEINAELNLCFPYEPEFKSEVEEVLNRIPLTEFQAIKLINDIYYTYQKEVGKYATQAQFNYWSNEMFNRMKRKMDHPDLKIVPAVPAVAVMVEKKKTFPMPEAVLKHLKKRFQGDELRQIIPLTKSIEGSVSVQISIVENVFIFIEERKNQGQKIDNIEVIFNAQRDKIEGKLCIKQEKKHEEVYTQPPQTIRTPYIE